MTHIAMGILRADSQPATPMLALETEKRLPPDKRTPQRLKFKVKREELVMLQKATEQTQELIAEVKLADFRSNEKACPDQTILITDPFQCKPSST